MTDNGAEARRLLKLQEQTLKQVLVACQAKRQALGERDFVALSAIISTLDESLVQAGDLERQFAELLQPLAGANEKEKFETLLELCAEDEASELASLREQVKSLLQAVRDVSRENIRLINEMLSDVGAAVQLLQEALQSKSATYSRSGAPTLQGVFTEGLA